MVDLHSCYLFIGPDDEERHVVVTKEMVESSAHPLEWFLENRLKALGAGWTYTAYPCS